MNKQQFISKWEKAEKWKEMLTDLENVIKQEIEERQLFLTK